MFDIAADRNNGESFTALHPAPAAMPHGSGWTGLTKRIWLLLYSEGGRWTSAEISARLCVQHAIHTTLREMVQVRLLMRADVPTPEGRVFKYGVGKGCKVPRDVTVDEMWDVLERACRSGG